jgi:hypothetical protein
MPGCKKCKIEIAPSFLYRHLSKCAPDTFAELPPHAKYWAPHELVKRGYFNQFPGIQDPLKLKKDVIWEALGEPWIRKSVDTALTTILSSPHKLQDFDHAAFKTRIFISQDVIQPSIYYRKMSQGEWDAVKNLPNPFQGTFNHINTDHYRYWMSSSLRKVSAFGNANATDTEGIIVKITFSQDPLLKFALRLAAHQKPGVQADASKVAVHREGFAEIGNMSTDTDLAEVLGPTRLHHNLGFTSTQAAELNGIKQTFVSL